MIYYCNFTSNLNLFIIFFVCEFLYDIPAAITIRRSQITILVVTKKIKYILRFFQSFHPIQSHTSHLFFILLLPLLSYVCEPLSLCQKSQA